MDSKVALKAGDPSGVSSVAGIADAGTETQVAVVDSFEGGNLWICFRLFQQAKRGK
jgi:hypothetical protein